MRTILSHLAQFSVLSRQSELLCTQGLAYLLRHGRMREAFAAMLTRQSGFPLAEGLEWRPEPVQADRGRPDLEARDRHGRVVVKIEAKLGAALGTDQIDSYVQDFSHHGGAGLLCVLVPQHRAAEAIDFLTASYALAGPAPWALPRDPGVVLHLCFWEDVLAELMPLAAEGPAGDVEQFASLYLALNGNDIEPLADREALLAWRARRETFILLVDRATRVLSGAEKVMPMGTEPVVQTGSDIEDLGYRRRYLSRPLAGQRPCFSIGVRDPFAGWETPAWLRFDRQTLSQAPAIRTRLDAGSAREGIAVVPSGGALWIPLLVPLRQEGNEMVSALVEQAEKVIRLVYDPPA